MAAGVDFVQERFMGQGKQDNESAVEQAKDEQISDFIRGKCTFPSSSTLLKVDMFMHVYVIERLTTWWI